MKKEEESKEVAIVQPKKKAIRRKVVLEGDPAEQLAYAKKAADALMSVVDRKPKKVIISGKTYLEFGDWQTLSRFFGATVATEWTKPLVDTNGKTIGYEARAVVYRNGEIISAAEGMCMRDEKRWKTAEEYAIRSMAQTRTSAKALRNAFGWVAELAGYASTPAEEMDGVDRDQARPAPITHKYAAPYKGGVDNYEGELPFETPTEQKQKISKLLLMLGQDVQFMQREDVEEFVERRVNLALSVENYEEIIRRLEILVSEKNEHGKN